MIRVGDTVRIQGMPWWICSPNTTWSVEDIHGEHTMVSLKKAFTVHDSVKYGRITPIYTLTNLVQVETKYLVK